MDRRKFSRKSGMNYAFLSAREKAKDTGERAETMLPTDLDLDRR